MCDLFVPSQTFDGVHADTVSAIALSDRCSVLATGGSDAAIAIWTQGGSAMVIDNAHADWVRYLFFCTDEIGTLMLASAGDDGLLHLWDALSCEHLSRSSRLASPIRAAAMCVGKKLIGVATEDGWIHVYSVFRRQIMEAFTFRGAEAPPTSLGFSQDGLTLVCAAEEFVRCC